MRARLTSTTTAPARPPNERRFHHPSYEKLQSQGWKALAAEASLSDAAYQRELAWALEMGPAEVRSLPDLTPP